jgi:hypothetical protein
MPEWDNNNPIVVKLWEDVSALYANQVSGEVRAVLGKNLRQGNIWETIELLRLKQNQNVNKILTIDPETKIETLLWTRVVESRNPFKLPSAKGLLGKDFEEFLAKNLSCRWSKYFVIVGLPTNNLVAEHPISGFSIILGYGNRASSCSVLHRCMQ